MGLVLKRVMFGLLFMLYKKYLLIGNEQRLYYHFVLFWKQQEHGKDQGS